MLAGFSLLVDDPFLLSSAFFLFVALVVAGEAAVVTAAALRFFVNALVSPSALAAEALRFFEVATCPSDVSVAGGGDPFSSGSGTSNDSPMRKVEIATVAVEEEDDVRLDAPAEEEEDVAATSVWE